MEFVEGDLGVGQAFRGAGDERRAHVDAHLGDGFGITAMGRQVPKQYQVSDDLWS
jgi:hypothetical protein